MSLSGDRHRIGDLLFATVVDRAYSYYKKNTAAGVSSEIGVGFERRSAVGVKGRRCLEKGETCKRVGGVWVGRVLWYEYGKVKG